MGVRAEYGDPSILLAVRLEALEDRLRVVEDRDSGIQLQRAIRTKLGVMPAPLAVPAHSNHVLAEKLPEARIRQQPVPRRSRCALGGRSGLEIDSGGVGAHPGRVIRHASEAGLVGPASREEGRGSCFSEGCPAAKRESAPAQPRPPRRGRGVPVPPPEAGAHWPSFGFAGGASRRRPQGPKSAAARTPGSRQSRSYVLETPPTMGVLTSHKKSFRSRGNDRADPERAATRRAGCFALGDLRPAWAGAVDGHRRPRSSSGPRPSRGRA